MNNENNEQIKANEELLEEEYKEIINKSFEEYHEKAKVVNEDILMSMNAFREKFREAKRLEELEKFKFN